MKQSSPPKYIGITTRFCFTAAAIIGMALSLPANADVITTFQIEDLNFTGTASYCPTLSGACNLVSPDNTPVIGTLQVDQYINASLVTAYRLLNVDITTQPGSSPFLGEISTGSTFTAASIDYGPGASQLNIQDTLGNGDIYNLQFNLLAGNFNLTGTNTISYMVEQIADGPGADSYRTTGSGELVPIAVAVPEPASLALLGTALFGLGAARRRRRKSA